MRQAEFLGFYVIAPLGMATLMDPRFLFPALFAISLVGLALLHFTEGFRWNDLMRGMGEVRARVVLGVAAVTLLSGSAVMLAQHREAFLGLPRERPELMLMIAALYPVLSVLPQEIVFRPLFFRRYGALLPGGWAGVMLNAAVFSFAHLMYWSWVVAVMTFAGGLVFAWAYELRRSFPLALVLHAVAGVILFALGMGVYFYSGNVQRPF